MIRAIVFDCFGVLTTDLWRAFLDDLPEDIDVAEARSLNQAFGTGIISREDFFQGVERLTGRTPPLTEDSSFTKNAQLLSYIKQLKGRGLKIGLLSNIASNWIRDSFLDAEEQALFDEMILSYEVGMVKPDQRIFELACKRLDVAPEETIMVDDIDRYCSAAESAGMHAVLYENFKDAKHNIDRLLVE